MSGSVNGADSDAETKRLLLQDQQGEHGGGKGSCSCMKRDIEKLLGCGVTGLSLGAAGTTFWERYHWCFKEKCADFLKNERWRLNLNRSSLGLAITIAVVSVFALVYFTECGKSIRSCNTGLRRCCSDWTWRDTANMLNFGVATALSIAFLCTTSKERDYWCKRGSCEDLESLEKKRSNYNWASFGLAATIAGVSLIAICIIACKNKRK